MTDESISVVDPRWTGDVNTQFISTLPTEVLLTLRNVINSTLKERNRNLVKPKMVERRLHAIRNFKEKLKDIDAKEEEDEFFEEWKSKIDLLNRLNLMAIPESIMRHSRPRHRAQFIYPLSLQNWKYLFSGASDDKGDFYVYCHCDPRDKPVYFPRPLDKKTSGLPFYIGKGSGGRAFDLKRNDGHGKMVRDIRKAGFSDNVIVNILLDGLTEVEALEMEAKLIYLLGSIYNPSVQGCLVNLITDSLRPEFDGVMPRKPGRRVKDLKGDSLADEWQR